MKVYAQKIFPLRVMTYIALFIVVNVALYTTSPSHYNTKSNFIKGYYAEKFAKTAGSPYLTEDLINQAVANVHTSSLVINENKQVRAWCIAGDVFLACLFALIIFGFTTVSPHISIIETAFHFIGLVLTSHAILENAAIGFFISGIVFGILVPIVIEIFALINIFVFKNEFY